LPKPTVAVLGTGKIGELVVAGLLRSGWPREKVLATARRPARAAELAERYGVEVVDNVTAAGRADVLAIAVKPQDAGALLDEIRGRIDAGRLVVSLCAGLPTGFFAPR
jgi:pyrroline-5-carboxylate reductase